MPHQCTTCGRTFADGSKEMLSGCPDCGGNKFQFQPSGGSASADSGDADAADSPDPTERERTDAGRQTPENAERQEADVEQEMPELARDAEEDATADPSPEPQRADVEREPSEPAREDANDQLGQRGGEIHETTGEENPAQRDARTSATTSEEIDEARRKMAEAEKERLAEVADDEESGRPKRGRGTPQGPPTDPPDEEETEQFGLSGAVGPPDDQPSAPESAEEEQLGGSDTDLSALREELNDQFESIKITAPGQYELNLMELYDRKEYIISLQEDGRYVVDIPEGHEHRED